jgi:hypothetical protein
MHGHEKRVCSCGVTISQCRCIEGGLNVVVIQNGCDNCHRKMNPHVPVWGANTKTGEKRCMTCGDWEGEVLEGRHIASS